jgi:hypothetical protein
MGKHFSTVFNNHCPIDPTPTVLEELKQREITKALGDPPTEAEFKKHYGNSKWQVLRGKWHHT